MSLDEDTQTQPLTTPAAPSLKARVALFLGKVARSRTALVATTAAVILAVAAATYGYQSMSTSVTLSVDGEPREVSALGDTVGEILDAEGIEVGEHDLVQPDLEEPVVDGDQIAVRYGRPVDVTVDGKTTTHWVTATDVEAAVSQIARLQGDARLVTSRSLTISRDGGEIEAVTPKKLTLEIAGAKADTRELAVLTVRELLQRLDVKVDKHDEVKPGLGAELKDGDSVVFTDIEVERKRVKREDFSLDTITREDDSEYEGTETVVREGTSGVRDVTYRLVFENGELAKRVIVREKVIDPAVAEIVEVGTKEEPTANYASGSTVWDALAQCESGGNWAINTGNGYYGGLQFSLSTWQAYGGPGYPHQQSRETQIAIAEKVVAATGGYGSWPACSASLGLPQ